MICCWKSLSSLVFQVGCVRNSFLAAIKCASFVRSVEDSGYFRVEPHNSGARARKTTFIQRIQSMEASRKRQDEVKSNCLHKTTRWILRRPPARQHALFGWVGEISMEQTFPNINCYYLVGVSKAPWEWFDYEDVGLSLLWQWASFTIKYYAVNFIPGTQ
jgi:hypothetical protein